MFKRIKHLAAALRETEKNVAEKLTGTKQSAFERFPLVFTLLGAFGLVATFYGFERLIDQVDFLSRNAWILLGTGIGTLIFTGTLYDKLK